jgi:hypothetical protein
MLKDSVERYGIRLQQADERRQFHAMNDCSKELLSYQGLNNKARTPMC